MDEGETEIWGTPESDPLSDITFFADIRCVTPCGLRSYDVNNSSSDKPSRLCFCFRACVFFALRGRRENVCGWVCTLVGSHPPSHRAFNAANERALHVRIFQRC